jgi:hypothetical protein
MSGIARIRPSRRFLIQQAVLNVMASAPSMVPTARSIAFVTTGATRLPGWLEAAVCREFRALSERWTA